MHALRKRDTGFTIVELLIVIVVIAILAAISVVAYTGIQGRAQFSATKAAPVQLLKSINLARIDSGNYPLAINSCPVPAAGSACLQAPSNFTATYLRLEPGARASPVGAGVTSEQSYELTLWGDSSVIYTSNSERTGTNEYLQYMDMAPIIDQYGLGEYQISFDIKSANTASASSVNVYMQNGSGAKYSFSANVPVSTTYASKTITVTPTLSNGSLTASVLAFYGTYGTGNIASVKNVEIIRVN